MLLKSNDCPFNINPSKMYAAFFVNRGGRVLGVCVLFFLFLCNFFTLKSF